MRRWGRARAWGQAARPPWGYCAAAPCPSLRPPFSFRVGPAVRGDLRKIGHGLDRILAHGGLAGEEQIVRAAPRRLIDVRDLGARGHGGVVHRVEHLRGDHKGTLRRAAFACDERLRAGQLPERHGVAEVAAGDHNDVRERKDLVEPMQPGHVLDLGKNFQLLRAGLAQGGAHGAQIVRAADKGLHERGDAVLPRAAEIFHIHLRERARGQLTARDGKALAGSEHPAALHAAGEPVGKQGFQLLVRIRARAQHRFGGREARKLIAQMLRTVRVR